LITSVAVSSDGTLATAGFDSVYRLWDFPTGDLMLELNVGRLAGFPSIGFSPDGSYLLYQDAGRVLRRYNLDLDVLVELAESRLTRTLTDAECQTYLHVEACSTG
jgi:WD40 repeat protein